MLTLLKIENFALIGDLSIEFGEGLNLLTGETGSGKSIIVDSLSALSGERVYSEAIKEGTQSSRIEGVFELSRSDELCSRLEEAGIDFDGNKTIELIVRREIQASGRNRVYINDKIVTQGLLKSLAPFLSDIHGQGEQTTLFSPASHLEILDSAAGLAGERAKILEKYRELSGVRKQLNELRSDESEKLQLMDILRFQSDEISRANPVSGEDEDLQEEKKRLNNVGELSSASDDVYGILYENEGSLVGLLEKVRTRIATLAEYDSRFREYGEGLESAYAVLEDLAYTVRDFSSSLEFSPSRLEEIEDRLAELGNLKRKYGGTIESVRAHLEEANRRLGNIESAEEKEAELKKQLEQRRSEYAEIATALHKKRISFAKGFSKTIEENLAELAMEKARFEIAIDSPDSGDLESETMIDQFGPTGYDRVEFLFSANPGESPKPLVKVASGGEASRLMLILKTAADLTESGKTAVFDEIDAGIGGRVAEAVGRKLKKLSASQQILCVTHQPQVASLADRHYVVEKGTEGESTFVTVKKLNEEEKVAEIARMLAGEKISDSARAHAKEMLKAAG